MIKPWPLISSREIADLRVFKLRGDLKKSPRTGEEHEFYILSSVDWVNVVAITTEQELVMVEQYRHGSGTVELEIPGGMMDAEESDPLKTGLRELKEETGYVGENPQLIGKIFANPAILTNRCHTLLVENCRCEHGVAFDGGEDLVTRLIPLREIPRMVAEGKIQHSLVVVALYHFDLHRRRT